MKCFMHCEHSIIGPNCESNGPGESSQSRRMQPTTSLGVEALLNPASSSDQKRTPGSTGHQCPQCNMDLAAKHNLMQHIRLQHEGKPIFGHDHRHVVFPEKKLAASIPDASTNAQKHHKMNYNWHVLSGDSDVSGSACKIITVVGAMCLPEVVIEARNGQVIGVSERCWCVWCRLHRVRLLVFLKSYCRCATCIRCKENQMQI